MRNKLQFREIRETISESHSIEPEHHKGELVTLWKAI